MTTLEELDQIVQTINRLADPLLQYCRLERCACGDNFDPEEGMACLDCLAKISDIKAGGEA